MNTEDEKWLKSLRDSLDEYAEPLPEGFWDELQEDLPRPKIVPIWKRWIPVAAAAVLVLSVSSLVLWKSNSSFFQSPDIQQANRMAEQVVESNVVRPVHLAVIPDEDSDADKKENTQPIQRLKNRQVAVAYEEKQDVSLDDKAVARVLLVDSVAEETEKSSEEPAMLATAKRSREVERRIWEQNAKEAGLIKHAKNRKVQIGILSGGMPYSSNKEFGGMTRFTSRYSVAKGTASVMDGSSKQVACNQVLFNNQHARAKTQVKHRFPITVGASVKWYLTDDWAVESGLCYTYLQSDLHSGSQLYLEDRQKLHYLGIPLKVHRTIWSGSRFSVYASAGGMLEKCVSGTLESAYVTGTGATETESVSLHIRPLQCSVMASLGTQFNFTRWLSLFVEPGMAYFFDDGSKVETIRKEHRFNFDLHFGIRFDISK